jgi:FkbM family methyltransferase
MSSPVRPCTSCRSRGRSPEVGGTKTSIRIQHLAGITEERRRARFQKYLAADPGRRFQPDYGHLLEPPGRLKAWEPRPPALPVAFNSAWHREAADARGSVPALSVVVISRNDEHRIARTLRSVVVQDCPESFEVLVVTSGSDRTAEIVRTEFPEVRIIELDRPALPGEARNAGLHAARGRYLSFPGSHVELPAGSLAARLRAHRMGYAMVTGTALNGTRTWAGWAAYFLDHSKSLPGRPAGVLAGPPTHCSYLRDALLHVGGFPEGLRAGEDTVVNTRLFRTGYGAYRAHELRFIHHTPCRTPWRLLRHHLQKGRAHGMILVRNARRERKRFVDRRMLRFLLIGSRRLDRITRKVHRWGRGLRFRYWIAFPLIVGGALAQWLGGSYELILNWRRWRRRGGQHRPSRRQSPAARPLFLPMAEKTGVASIVAKRRRARNWPKSAQGSRRSSILKHVVRRVVVRHPWIDLILGSEWLSRRYGRRLVSLLRRNPRLELRFRGSIRISEFSLRFYGERLHEVLRRNPPRGLRFKRNGVELSVPWEVGTVGYAFGNLESLTGRWLTDHLRPGSVGIDVGAHMGYFTVLMAKIVGRAGRVYAVEPAEENLHFLRKNVKENRVHNVTILPFAAGKQSRVRNFHLMDQSDIHGFYKHPSLGNVKEIVQVRESPLDELVKGPVDVVKVDVEGAELEVLEGMRGILRSNPKVALVVEWNPKCLMAVGYAADALPAYLRANGFTPFLIDNLSGAIGNIEEVVDLAKSDALDPRWYGNLICQR